MRTVLITGTSTGFGLVTTVELAKQGWRVFATMRNLERKGKLEEALAAAGVAGNVDISTLDVTDASSVRSAVAGVLEKTGGHLDAVVHNAGIAVGGVIEDIPEADLRRVMETNFWGVLELTRALLPTFRAQRRGRIVIVSSESGLVGQPANSIYCASKFAIEGWAESICYELAPFNIDVVLIEPGPYMTDIWSNSPRICPENSAYRSWVQYMFRAGDAHAEEEGGDPQDVAVRIAKVLSAKRPRFRNPVGKMARISHAMRGKMPSLWLRRITERYLGLHRLRS